MNNNQFLNEILSVPEQNRDFNWDEKFFKVLSESSLRLLSKEPKQGPDHWPYLICETLNNPVIEDRSEDIESAQKIFFWLASRGIGLVVNPRREPYPDYVFSYGMIWNFRETGFFLQPDLEKINKSKETNQVSYENNKIFTGAPTEKYLPGYVRKVLKDFFRDQTILNPKVLMISQDNIHFDLCFSLESLGNPPDNEHEGIAEALSWFLPTHYSIVLISEKSLPEFLPL